VNNATHPVRYFVSHNSHGFNLVAVIDADNHESLGLFPSRAEANDALETIRTLAAARAAKAAR
jgi:hypothetical protein